jgi:phenylalanyl-tRNA synthetase beta chain
MPRPPVAVRPPDDVLETINHALPSQPLHLAAAIAGHRQQAGWWGEGRAAGWQDAVQAARTIAASVGAELTVDAAPMAPWHPGRCAALSVAGELVGYAGELHPRVVEAFDLPPRTCAMEIALESVLASAPELAIAPVVSAYPPATIDVALVVDAAVPAASIGDALRIGAGPLLEELRLFDVYSGEPIPAGKRSLAFSLRLRAPDRTLTAEEAVAVRDSAVSLTAQRFGAELRS